MFCGSIARLILPVDYKGALLVLLWSTMMFIYLVFMAYYVSNERLLDAAPIHMNKHLWCKPSPAHLATAAQSSTVS